MPKFVVPRQITSALLPIVKTLLLLSRLLLRPILKFVAVTTALILSIVKFCDWIFVALNSKELPKSTATVAEA